MGERESGGSSGSGKLTAKDWFSDEFLLSRELIERVFTKYRRSDSIDTAIYTIVKMRSTGETACKTTLNSAYGIYPDAEFGFVLRKCGNPIASIWFDVPDTGVLFVKQIQGKKGLKEDLCAFRWERMLIRLLVEWARGRSFKEVRVVRGLYQEWCRDWEDRKKKFFMIYDVSAKREGFAPGTMYHWLVLNHEGGMCDESPHRKA